MARSPNCTGAPLFKGRVDVSISYPDPDETLLETPVALPTSEPASPQVSYTLGGQHMPVWSPYELKHKKIAVMYAGGKNVSGSASTVYYRILKNGESVATGSRSIPSGEYYTWSHYQFPIGLVAGDALACKLWASGANVNWDYKALIVAPTRIGPPSVVADVLIAHDYWSALTLGTPSAATNATIVPVNADAFWNPVITNPFAERCAAPGPIYGLVRLFSGDYSVQSECYASASYHPVYIRRHSPSRIAYTPLNLRV